jgi:hypothetical protein
MGIVNGAPRWGVPSVLGVGKTGLADSIVISVDGLSPWGVAHRPFEWGEAPA